MLKSSLPKRQGDARAARKQQTSRCFLGSWVAKIPVFPRRGGTGPLLKFGNNSKNSEACRRAPRPSQGARTNYKSIRDTTRDANGGHSPSRNGASKDDDDATTRHAVHPSNAKSIRSTSTVLPQAGRRRRFRSPRRRASPGRISSSFYLLVAYQLTAQREDEWNYSH